MTFDEWWESVGRGVDLPLPPRGVARAAWDAAVAGGEWETADERVVTWDREQSEYLKGRLAAARGWTRDAPTAPGFYWLRWMGRPPAVAEVFRGDHGALCVQCYCYATSFTLITALGGEHTSPAEWLGPLEVPG